MQALHRLISGVLDYPITKRLESNIDRSVSDPKFHLQSVWPTPRRMDVAAPSAAEGRKTAQLRNTSVSAWHSLSSMHSGVCTKRMELQISEARGVLQLCGDVVH